jgi:heptosyltransferase III
MEHLRSAYTEVWISRPVVPLVKFADHVEAIAGTGLDQLGVPGLPASPRLLERLRTFDRIVSWYGTNRDEFRESVEGFPFEFHAALPSGGSVHAADFFGEQVGLTGSCVPRIPVARAATRGFVAIHSFSGSPKKNWTLEGFDSIAARHRVEWCATGEQRPLLCGREPVHCFDDLMDLAGWLAGASCYVGNDSGITHLAAAVGAPVLAIFTDASDPRVWGPRGERVRITSSHAIERLVRSRR